MSASETVKLEIEVPKDQVERILASSEEPQITMQELDKELDKQKRITKFKKQLALVKSESSSPVSNESSGDNLAVKASPAQRSSASILPQTNDTSPPNPNQKKIIFIGLAVAVTGLLLWPLSNFIIASIIAVIGAAVVATGTFVKV